MNYFFKINHANLSVDLNNRCIIDRSTTNQVIYPATLVLMLLTKFVRIIAPLEDAVSASNVFLNFYAKLAKILWKFIPNSTKKLQNLNHYGKWMQIRCWHEKAQMFSLASILTYLLFVPNMLLEVKTPYYIVLGLIY